MTKTMDFLDQVFWGNPVRSWAIALGICLGVAVGLRLVLALLKSRLGRLVKHTRNQIDDAIVASLGRTPKLTLLVIGLAVAAQTLELPSSVDLILRNLLMVVLMVQVGLWAAHAVTGWLEHYRARQMESDRGAATAVGAISFVVQVTIWTMALLAILSNLGINITALITGLGIGGIAVALALQNVFKDLFASLSIVFDKPFVLGDFIVVGEHLGSVEHVGLKTTRVRSLSGEQLVFANSDLLTGCIRNYGRMYERRVVFQLGVTYQTAQKKLVEIPGIIRAAIEELENTRFDRSNFAKYGDFALNFETVYYVLAADYNLYMDIQEKINLKIRERFIAEEIEFAYPTQKLFLEREGV
jgi:small-conductance mechanosensitive channel